MSRPVIPVILSGGSGTRLWPLSTPEKPKQFLKLVTEHSLLQDTVLRTRGIEHPLRAPIVVCNEAHRYLVAEQFRELGLKSAAIVLEPAGRNTAPAVAVAALIGAADCEPGDEPILLVLPADHVIRERAAFVTAVDAAIEAALDGNLVTFGVVPDRAETGYGYIRQGASQGAWSVVESFVEKPDRETAERYLEAGNYLWNSGMFVFSVRTFLRELGMHAPEMVAAAERAVAEAERGEDFMRLGEAFLESPSDSIDYAVMEKTDRAAVVALEAGWSDVGSWRALLEVLERDADGNVTRGDAIAEDCRNCLIAAHGRTVVAAGLENTIVVATDDAVLVLDPAQGQKVKELAERLARRKDRRA